MGVPVLALALALLAFVLVLGLSAVAGCGSGSRRSDTEKFSVGLVFDVGGLGDKSFNDSAYQGLVHARDSLGVDVEYLEPAAGTDREAALRQMAAGDRDLVFGIGMLFSDDIATVARDFPNKEFACVDYTVQEGAQIPPNLAALKFREEQGAFLVGAIAGLVTKTGKVGFVGGMEIPLIRKFEAGYRAGVRHVNPGAEVLVAYAGVTPDAFKNPAKGRELALAQYDAGADIVFHASGSTGLGVFEAARRRDALAIGVDADQQAEAPGHVLTSMIKRVDVAVFETIRAAKEGRFPGGEVQVMGLENGAIDYVYDEANQKWITPEIHDRVEGLKREILAGTIEVPSR
ncbi:MAG: BMP family ABC transporter substrate-binding protein [Candidatus Eisenbacteria bacterium]|nr:BMP family ABC transporter substrate-binding protein [Candidatus Eisenbacteria bacterium]